MKTRIKTPGEIVSMRKSGNILATILEDLKKQLEPGVTTQHIDDMARDMLASHGAKAAFLGYNGFPAHICISVNDETVHGIPSARELANGDVVKLDFGVSYEGMITDSAITIVVGEASAEAERLLKYTKQALSAAINVLADGIRVGDIGYVIENELNRGNLKVIHNLGGHGVGHKVHEDPIILNFGNRGTGPVLRAGMTIALEPIASLSTHDVYLDSDKWTYKTVDGSISAQFEHTILITQDGAEILTAL